MWGETVTSEGEDDGIGTGKETEKGPYLWKLNCGAKKQAKHQISPCRAGLLIETLPNTPLHCKLSGLSGCTYLKVTNV